MTEHQTGRDLAREPRASALIGQLIDISNPEWQAVLDTARHEAYHLPAYVGLCAAQEHGRPAGLHVTDGERSMLLPLVIRDVGGGASDATSPYGYPGPLVTDDDPLFLSAALATGRQTLLDAGIVSAFIRLHPLLNTATPTGCGTIVEHGRTVSIDLGVSDETLWRQMRNNHRRDIARARRLGFTAHVDEEWRHFETFKRLYRGTMERRGAGDFYFFDDAYFAQLRRALGNRLQLEVVEREGAVVAAGLFITSDSIVEYHLSGASPQDAHRQATKLMLHDMSLLAKRQGLQTFHLGGGIGGHEDSLFHFKVGFSPRTHVFRTLRMVVNRPAYRRMVAAVDPMLDPMDDAGYFPAYRALQDPNRRRQPHRHRSHSERGAA